MTTYQRLRRRLARLEKLLSEADELLGKHQQACKHNYKVTETYHTPGGLVTISKCELCGDMNTEID